MAAQTLRELNMASRIMLACILVRIMLAYILARIMLAYILACIMVDFVLCLNSYYACLHYA